MKAHWIANCVEQFKSLCHQLQEQLDDSAEGDFLERSEAVMDQFQRMLKDVEQQALQHQIQRRMALPCVRRCPCCHQPMRHKGFSRFRFIVRHGHLNLKGIYYRCSCGQSKTVGDFINRASRLSKRARELILRYGGSFSYAQARRFLYKEAH